MKQTIYNLLILCLLFSVTTNLTAQEVECNRDFTINTHITVSTCAANGVIEVTLGGDLSNLDMSKAEYGLEPVAGTTGTKLLPGNSNILRGIAPGTYTVSVRTFCKVGDEFGRVKELLNVTVGGNYKPLMADIDQKKSRKSYKECATGIIAFNVTNNTGYGDLKFYITKAPVGITTGEVFPTKGTIASNQTPYTLSGLYPPGQYQIDIDDNCGKSTIVFTIEEVVGLPTLNTNYSTFRPPSNNTTCNSLQWTSTIPDASSFPDYYRYYTDGLYEIAIMPSAQTPSASDWVAWNASAMILSLPGEYEDYYLTNSFKLYVRLKGCEEVMSIPYYSYIYKPYLRYSFGYHCNYAAYSLGVWNDRDGFLCYPLTAKVIKKEDGSVLHTETMETYKSAYMLTSFQYEYNTDYTVELSDNSNFKMTENKRFTFNSDLNFNISSHNCDSFSAHLSLTSYYYCYPINLDIYKLKDGGSPSVPGDYILVGNHTYNTSAEHNKVLEWAYGNYKLVSTFPNHLTKEGVPYTATKAVNVVPTRPTAYSLSLTVPTSFSCVTEDLGSLYISSSAPSASTRYPIGTTFTVVEAPAGYAYLGVKRVMTSSSYYYEFPRVQTSPGKYKVEIDDGCNNIITVEANLNGAFSARNANFVIEQDGCEGERLKLDGLVTNAGVNSSGNTFFQIISGPQGFDNTVKTSTQSILLAADGQYVVGIKAFAGNSCYLKKETIHFTKTKPIFDASVTSSYLCTEKITGYIIVAGKGGSEPYRFDLLNYDKTPTGAVATETADGRAYFDYGTVGQSYFVRITDDCGNQNDQEVLLTDLKTQRIIYNTPPSGEYCVGDEIRLHCITLGETTYLWTGPNSYTSSEQHPVISPATVDMTGYYTVSVMPEFCGLSVTDQLYIKVFPELVAGQVSADQDICVATRPQAISGSGIGGRGLHQYQWLESSDGITWTNVFGATNANYVPPISSSIKTHYYRLQITDACKAVLSDIITLNVKACYIMINPNLRSKGQR